MAASVKVAALLLLLLLLSVGASESICLPKEKDCFLSNCIKCHFEGCGTSCTACAAHSSAACLSALQDCSSKCTDLALKCQYDCGECRYDCFQHCINMCMIER